MSSTPPQPPSPEVGDPGRAERQAMLRAAVPAHLDRLEWSARRVAEHQQEALRTLLRVAVNRSPFHARRLAGVDPDRVTLDDLGSLPPMTKTEMMADLDDVLTDRRLSRELLEAHLDATGFDAAELLGEFTVMASGGSSGIRGVFAYSRTATIDYLLGLIRPGIARMVAVLGRLPDDPIPTAIVSAGSAVHASRALASLFGGDLMAPTSISASDPLDGIVGRLNQLQPLLLQGYPSAVRRLADEQLAGRLRIGPLGVTTSSEPLSPTDRARIAEAFGVGVVDNFGSTEGLLGASPPDDDGIVLASDLAIVELVDDEYRPVPQGTPSARVLLTNLFNHVQPLIRYELTDSFTQLPSAAGSGHMRVRVDGRSDEALRYGDLTIHPIAVRSVMVGIRAAVEYQVHQTVTGIDVRVVAPDGIDTADLAGKLATSLRTAGLPDPEVRVQMVAAADLWRHPHTNKTPRFITLPAER